MGPDERTREARVEPLFEALQEGTAVKEEEREEPRSARRGLMWKLFWAGLLFFGLVALVIKQSF